MLLYLIRHGIAVDREAPNCPPDPERPLTPKGMKRSHAAALGLHALDVKPNAVLTSPWLRALQTAQIFCETIGYPSKKIIRTDALKGTSAPADLLREIQTMKAKVVLCFGHEPHLHLVIGHVLHTSAKITELKKAGLAVLDLERISPPQGRLLALYPASTLRQLAK
ncbi:MAG TPA: phosphoglycerate mutase family protein [Candidatus Sulfotelmatobacter sp.]|jgi:phosphohistidine phosphatase|nr:phosphoglycerate mutase family protein [Candidatus Sulfotelmatobacter sp.]